jgi:uncharacterized protein YecE (DUF72 family)
MLLFACRAPPRLGHNRAMSARPARSVGRILVGTTSWTEHTPHERGRFYPAELKSPEDRLQYYASVFPVVEVDNAFYALPSARDVQDWVERTDDGFVFDVKAFRLFAQHATPLRSLPSDLRAKAGSDHDNVYYDKLPRTVRQEVWHRFRAALEPLRSRDRLGTVLFQFAPRMLCNPSGLEHIAHCAEQLPGFQVAVELHHATWRDPAQRERTSQFLRDHHVTQVVVDEAQETAFSAPSAWAATADVAVLRLSGRKRRDSPPKRRRPAAERVPYQYTDEELTSFIEPVKKLARQSREVHVLFDNCYSDWAERNASRFTELLGKRATSMRGPRKRS